MNRLTIKQTQYINRIAEVHEAELERQNTTYKRLNFLLLCVLK